MKRGWLVLGGFGPRVKAALALVDHRGETQGRLWLPPRRPCFALLDVRQVGGGLRLGHGYRLARSFAAGVDSEGSLSVSLPIA